MCYTGYTSASCNACAPNYYPANNSTANCQPCPNCGTNGVCCAASCSSHVTPDDFLSTLDDDALARDDLRVVTIAGAGADHPVVAGFPEGRYLKFVVLR